MNDSLVNDVLNIWKVPGPVKPDTFDVPKVAGISERLPVIGTLAPTAKVIGPVAIRLPEVVEPTTIGGAPEPAAKLKVSVSRKLNV